MLKGLSIQNFRGIREGALEDLSQVNLLVGRNNSGKSTVLDALLLARAPFQVMDRLGINCIQEMIQRRVERKDYDYKELWHRYDTSQPIGLTLQDEKRQTLSIAVTERGGAFIFQMAQSETANRLAQTYEVSTGAQVSLVGGSWNNPRDAANILRNNFDPTVIMLLARLLLIDTTFVRRLPVVEQLWKEIKANRHDKKITGILNDVYGLSIEYLEYVPDDRGQYRIHASMADRSLAIDTVGEGLRAAFSVLSVLSLMKEAILLVEELETHQHPESLRKLVAVVFEYAKRNDLQLFMTTQSLEFITYALEEATQRQLDLKLHHLDLDQEGKLSVRSLSLPDAKVLADVGPDLRTLYKYVS